MKEHLDTLRFEQLVATHHVRPAALARLSGYSRQHRYRLRKGRMDPTRKAMVTITAACSILLQRRVHLWEVFDIREDDATR